MSGRVDCIVVGYHDVDFQRSVDEAHAVRNFSGAYESIRTNSIAFDHRRITYMELLNRTLQASQGRNPQLHVANMPSLGAWYLSSYLRKRGFHIEVINFFTAGRTRFAELLDEDPRAVAITTTFYLDPKPIVEIIRFIRQLNRDVKIIVGGPHVFNLCEHFEGQPEALANILREIGADIAVFDSQGELTLARLLHHLRGDEFATDIFIAPAGRRSRSNSLRDGATHRDCVRTRRLSTIPNLLFFEDGAMVRTPREVESNDMDVFSEDWADVASEHFTPCVVTRTARSCAFSCAFCRYPVMAGPLNLKSLQVVERQFDVFQERGVKQVVIIDDTFNVPLPRFKDLCRLIIRKKYDFEWFSYFRASNADESCFDLMAASRCGGVFLGIESGDQTILNNMHKSSRVDKYLHAIRQLRSRGIITFASIIVGFPGETRDTIRNTMQFLEEAQPQFYRAELYYHGTNAPIHEQAQTYGIASAGYSWRHNTMDWQEACEHVSEMYRSVRNSTILPLHNFDFWCIPYLLGHGISKQQFHEFVRGASALLVDDLCGAGRNARLEVSNLAATFSRPGQLQRRATAHKPLDA